MPPRRPPQRAKLSIFEPPFYDLWIAVFILFTGCCLIASGNKILNGILIDSDDYMYLDQIVDLLRGQGWYDNIQHRINPPEGTPIHFPRMIELPMAALAGLFHLFGMSLPKAALTMSLIGPLVLLAGFFVTIRWLAQNFVPKEWAGVTAYVILFSMPLLPFFFPGHIDHHNLIVVLVVLAAGFSIKAMKDTKQILWSVAAGLTMAFALAAALEVLPWLIIFSAWFGLWAVVKGGQAARHGFAYGLSIFLFSCFFLLLTWPPALLLATNGVSFSITYVYLTAGIAVVFGSVFLVRDKPAFWRWICAIVVASVTSALYLTSFPDLITGPMGMVDPILNKLILNEMVESVPLIENKKSWLLSVIALIEPLLALGAGLYYLRHTQAKDRWPLSLVMALLAASLLLTAFYQNRYVGGLWAFTVIPLTMLLQCGWNHVHARERGWRRICIQTGLLLLVGPLPMIILPALAHDKPISEPDMVCHLNGIENVLAPYMHDHSPIIMNTTEIGPELILRLPVMVLAAPFHQNVRGNLDAVKFFSTSNPKDARHILEQRKASLVVLCTTGAKLYTDIALHKVEHSLVPRASSAKDTMIMRLSSGENVPDWLRSITVPEKRNYRVYEVVSGKTKP